jgi:hypothetical protein
MIEEILKLINESGKLFSLTALKVSVDSIKGKQIEGIYPTDYSNMIVLITRTEKLYEVYCIFNSVELQKTCISFEELDFDDL